METVLVCHAAGEFLEQAGRRFRHRGCTPVLLFWTEIRELGSHDVAEIDVHLGDDLVPEGCRADPLRTCFTAACTAIGSCRSDARRPLAHHHAGVPFELPAGGPDAGAHGGRRALVVLKKYSARRFWTQVRASSRHGAFSAVAMMARTMMMQPLRSPKSAITSVRDGAVLPARSPTEEKEAFEQPLRRASAELLRLHRIGVLGVDRSCPTATRQWPSVGRAGLGYDVDIVNEEGAIVCSRRNGRDRR